MAETRTERRESWKQRTSKTAAALKSAGATYTPSKSGGRGSRSVPLSATTVEPGETKSKIVSEYGAGKRGAELSAAVSGPTPPGVTSSRIGDSNVFKITHKDKVSYAYVTGEGDVRYTESLHRAHAHEGFRTDYEPTHRELALGAMTSFQHKVDTSGRLPDKYVKAGVEAGTLVKVDDAPPGIKSSAFFMGIPAGGARVDTYVPSPYRPGTQPEDVEYGKRPKFDQPQIHDIIWQKTQEMGNIFSSGFSMGMGEVPTTEDKTHAPVKPDKEYVTKGFYDLMAEKGEDYRRFLTSTHGVKIGEAVYGINIEEQIKDIVGTGLSRLQGGGPTLDDVYSETFGKMAVGFVKETPVMALETIGLIPPAFEIAIRSPFQLIGAIPYTSGLMAGGMVSQFKEEPFETTGGFIGMLALGKGGKVGGRVYTSVKTKVPGDLFYTQKLKPPAGLTQEQLLKFEAGAEIATKLKHADAPLTDPLMFADVKALRGKSPEIVESWIKAHPEQKPTIAGSTAAKAQFERGRTPGDLDLYVKDAMKAGDELYALLSKDAPRGEVRLLKQKKYESTIVEIKDPVTGTYHHGVDIHTIVPAGSSLRFGMKTQAPVKIKDVRYVRAGELVQRKAESILQKQAGGKIGPQKHRKKDIADFISFTEEFITKQKKQAETSVFLKGRKKKKAEALEEHLEIYKMYSTPSYELMADTMAWYRKQGFPTKLGISAAVVGVTGAYPKEGYPKEGRVKTAPYVAPRVSDRKTPVPPYIHPRITDTKQTGYVPPKTPDTKTYPYVPPRIPDTKTYPYPVQEVPELPPTPPQTKIGRLNLEKKQKEQAGRVRKETPGYAWQLANPIATLEQLLGGRRTKKPRTKTKKTKRRSKR